MSRSLDENENLKYINDRIAKEVCYDAIEQLKDENLIPEYIKSNSVSNNIERFKKILEKNDIDNLEQKYSIIKDCLEFLIPPGTKGVLRGNKFNSIVKQKIISFGLNEEIYDIKFEKNHPEPKFTFSEIPDFYIYNKITNSIIIGMNQLDLWSGGQQTNRGDKYLSYNNDKNFKLLCVVCNKTEIKSKKDKKYKLFNKGFNNNTLCYLGGLKTIIDDFFNISLSHSLL